MYNREKSVWKSVDWVTIGIYVLMVAAGWLSICGASYEYEATGLFGMSGRPMLQLFWIGTALILVFIILMLDRSFFETFAYLIYGLIILLLIATIFLAPAIKGSHSWLALGPLRIQPAEFAKFATALVLAKFMSSYNFDLFTVKNFSIVLLMIFFPMGCILLQKETGSSLVFLAFTLMLYREGMSGFILLASVCAVAFFVIVLKYAEEMLGATPLGELIVSGVTFVIMVGLTFIFGKNKKAALTMLYILGLMLLAGFGLSFYMPVNYVWFILGAIGLSVIYLVLLSLKNLEWNYVLIGLFAVLAIGFLLSVNYVFDNVLEYHQQMRIKVALGLENDPSGAGYNVNQSMIAIGSGGFSGKGFLNGTQTMLKYVPEQDTDFIFCTVGEEFGFLGSLLVLCLFGVLIIRLVYLAERQDSAFGRVYGYCAASIFFFHLLVNIGMVLGLTPVIGIPLPFFSYGGSSLWGFTILLFIFLWIDAGRKET